MDLTTRIKICTMFSDVTDALICKKEDVISFDQITHTKLKTLGHEICLGQFHRLLPDVIDAIEKFDIVDMCAPDMILASLPSKNKEYYKCFTLMTNRFRKSWHKHITPAIATMVLVSGIPLRYEALRPCFTGTWHLRYRALKQLAKGSKVIPFLNLELSQIAALEIRAKIGAERHELFQIYQAMMNAESKEDTDAITRLMTKVRSVKEILSTTDLPTRAILLQYAVVFRPWCVMKLFTVSELCHDVLMSDIECLKLIRIFVSNVADVHIQEAFMRMIASVVTDSYWLAIRENLDTFDGIIASVVPMVRNLLPLCTESSIVVMDID